MEYYYFKALHIIFIVTWFAGLFYIVRLFIYHIEAQKKVQPDRSILEMQYKIMEKRLWYIITWPSAILSTLFALAMLYLNPDLLRAKWMLVKLVFVICLFVYHIACHNIYKQLQNDQIKYSSMKMRVLNEISTIILFAIVFLVVLQNNISWVWSFIGLLLISMLIMLGIHCYKKIKKNN